MIFKRKREYNIYTKDIFQENEFEQYRILVNVHIKLIFAVGSPIAHDLFYD